MIIVKSLDQTSGFVCRLVSNCWIQKHFSFTIHLHCLEIWLSQILYYLILKLVSFGWWCLVIYHRLLQTAVILNNFHFHSCVWGSRSLHVHYWPSIRSRCLDIGQVLFRFSPYKCKIEQGQSPATLTQQAWLIKNLLYGQKITKKFNFAMGCLQNLSTSGFFVFILFKVFSCFVCWLHP